MNDNAYLDVMIAAIESALDYRHSEAPAGIVYKATLFELVTIGEMANCLSPEIRNENAYLPWRRMIAVRNRLVHNPDNLDPNIIAEIVNHDLPLLKKSLLEIKKEMGKKYHG